MAAPVVKRRTLYISDEGLRCFVEWCRLNDEQITSNIPVVRGVLEAYATVESPPTGEVKP